MDTINKNFQKKPTENIEYHCIDWWLLASVLIIVTFGLLMVLSAGSVVAERDFGDKYFFFKRQFAFVIFGFITLIFCTYLPRRIINNIHYLSIIAVIFLLLLTLSPFGSNVNGASRWIQIFGFSLQPMEFAKIALVLYLSYFLSTHQHLGQTFSKGVIPPFAITGILCMLLLLQPDFGACVILLAILFFLCLAGGTRFIYLAFSFTMMATMGISLMLNSTYRMRRLLAFIDPFKDAQGTGYQLVQSFYALAEGGYLGVGMGNGRQKLLYLPEAHNDFIVSVIGEELGLLGITLMMGLFMIIFARCYRIILGQKNLQDKLMAFGLTLIIVLGTTLNLAVIMGMVPPKGVAMPFLSYGGSSLLASMICMGLLLNYSRTVHFDEKKPTKRLTNKTQMQKVEYA